MEMENKIRYPLTASRQTTPEGRTHIVDSDGLPHIMVYRGLIGNRGRYIAACLNACMDMELETLESGAPGWIAQKLKDCKPEKPFLDALLDTTDQLIKSQLASDFKVIELQNKLDAANKLSSALAKEVIEAKSKIQALEAERSELLEDLSIKEGIIEDQRDQW